ncbi:uncharacterized protein LOC129002236 isoform X2 [Macrosteles quadrilineatus]|nr:uncharacterized protein LOC129002236 isoform X2 [Macrosteles quadrilineatus]XP_054285868.1 uncharacterized protein LOC129002236 isoform X2 [Macrosteles quadrilineatus]XP_054285869.1 uncharacterized protein LOC129002236 isoform X2 [Macrosteles quadrilineatus]
MPQDRRRSCDEYDVICSDFPPPSLKPANSPDQDKRKKKKWSIGGLFRRKKKVSDTDSSSPVEDEEEKKGFLERRRARKRRNRGSKDVTGSFEAVIINHRHSQLFDTIEPREERVPSEKVLRSHESLARREPNIRGSSVSLEGTGKRGGRLQVKARVEESRERLRGDSSSDDGGGSSKHSSSSIQRLKSDETISKDGSLSRRSRAARTERYKKRLSKDEESLRDFRVPSRISRSDERLSNKKVEKPPGNNRWTAKVVYYESSDYETKYTAVTKSATPSPIQSPKARPKNALHYTASAPPTSNYVTYPPSHAREGVAGSHQELRTQHYPLERVPPHQRYPDITPPRLPKSNSDMITKPAQSSTPRPIQNRSWNQEALNRKSASYDCNVNSIHHINNQIVQPHPTDENVLVVQFPLSKPVQKVDNKVKMGLHSLQHGRQQNPPPPPPRDPQRKLFPSNGYHESSPRPMSYAFEDKSPVQQKYPKYPEFGSSSSAFQRVMQSHPVSIDFEPAVSMNRHQRSSSDNHIPSRIGVKQSPPMPRRILNPELGQRHRHDSFDSSHSSPPSANDYLPSSVPCHYQYYTDQHPRSRKPIHISYQNQKPQNDPYLSDSQVIVKPPVQQTPRTRPSGVQNAADFWKQKDQENTKKIHISEGSPKLIQRHLLNLPQAQDRSRSSSPLTDRHSGFAAAKLKLPPLIISGKETESSHSLSSSSPRDNHSPRILTGKYPPVHNEIGIPVFSNVDVHSNTKRPLSMLEEKQEISEKELTPTREKMYNPPTPPLRKDSKVNAVTNFEHFDIFNENDKSRRKSNNLEEALNELEAIYKSLRLGEDANLEKIAKDQAVYENNRLDPSNWNAWVQSRGFESDSSLNYSRSSLDSVDSVDSPFKSSSNSRRGGEPDKVTDDMAYRKYNRKDRPPPQEQEVISQAGSFLLVSPTLSPPPFVDPPPVHLINKEPDIEKDDVVYRNFKHVNNSLKCLDPQPPFGIPLGPITPAPNSDYLHVSPKETFRPSFKPKKIPDVVTDDLAFRNLRKDSNKEPRFTFEENSFPDSPTTKKKRAVRSLSANLLSIIQRESLAMKNNNNKLIYNNNDVLGKLEKSQSFSDVKDALSTNGPCLNGQANDQHNKIKTLVYSKNLSGEDSDVTPRNSRVFSLGTSSPLTATSTETLTGSKTSLLTSDSRPSNSKLSKSPSPRLSLTPERRHTTDNVNIHQPKSIPPSKYTSAKNDSLRNAFFASHPNNDFKRSSTPDNNKATYHISRFREHTPPSYNKNESDLLAILAREAKEASEQLSKELNELNFDIKPLKNKVQVPDSLEIENSKPESKFTPLSTHPSQSPDSPVKQTHTKSQMIGKITPHKPVKLNTFVITEDNKLESKQTQVTENPIDIVGSKSMTDLLKELTRSLDEDFGNSSTDKLPTSADKSNDKEGGLQKIETKCEVNFTDGKDNCNADVTECEDTYFSTDEIVSDERFSSPEKFLQTFVAEAIENQKVQTEQKTIQSLAATTSDSLDLDQSENQELIPNKTDIPLNIIVSCDNNNEFLKVSTMETECNPSVEKSLTEDDLLVNSFKDDSHLNLHEQDPTPLEVDEVLSTLNEESSKHSDKLSPESSPLPKRFPLELPQDEVIDKSSKSEVSSHPIEADSTESSSPGTSRESRLVTARPRDCIDCPRMTDEGKTCLKGCVTVDWTACVHERA